MSFESVGAQWDDGQRRLRDASPELAPVLERVVDRIVAELRRRLGARFTSEELVDLYGRGTDWTLEIAVDAAPDRPRPGTRAWWPTRPSPATCARPPTTPAAAAPSLCRATGRPPDQAADSSSASACSSPARRMTICSASTTTSTGR